ncbi:MAG: transcriptional regulator [Salibacteraceae bacterium]
MFKSLDPILHSPLRLAIMSLLMSIDKADFTYLKDKTSATSGNLSVQITKLEDAGYIKVIKGYKGKRPHTVCSITRLGKTNFQLYVNALNDYLKPTS